MVKATQDFEDDDGVFISEGQELGLLVNMGEAYNTILNGFVTCVTDYYPPIMESDD